MTARRQFGLLVCLAVFGTAAGQGTATRPARPATGPAAGPHSGVTPPDPSAPPAFGHGTLEAIRDASGKPEGVRVVRVQRGGRLARIGLRPGDLLLRINGVPLDNPETFRSAVATAQKIFVSPEKITVRVKREGKAFSLAEMAPVRMQAPPAEPKPPGP